MLFRSADAPNNNVAAIARREKFMVVVLYATRSVVAFDDESEYCSEGIEAAVVMSERFVEEQAKSMQTIW